MKNKAGTIIEISQPFPDLPAVQGFQPATWPEVWPDHKSDMLSHILWSVCLIRWRLTLPFSINVPFYFKWGLFLKKKNLFRGGNYHVKPVCKSFCWDLLLRIRRACFSFTGISVELMALLMLLSWKRSRERFVRAWTSWFSTHTNIISICRTYNRHNKHNALHLNWEAKQMITSCTTLTGVKGTVTALCTQ